MIVQRNSRLSFIILILLTVSELAAQSVVLKYNDFITNIRSFHPLAKKADNSKEFGRLQNLAAAGNYDPQLRGSYTNKFFNGSNYYSTAGAELKQAVFTNQHLKLGYDFGMGSQLNPELQTPTRGLPYVGIEVGVLQGLLIDKRRADVLKSREYINYYEADQKMQLNDLLFLSSQSYFNWLFNARVISLNNYFMELARQRLIGVEALAEIGEEAAIDTVEAAIFYQTRLLDLQSAIVQNQKQMNELAGLNWSENGLPAMETTFVPFDSLDVYYLKSKNLLATLIQDEVVNNPVISKYNSLQQVLEIEKRLKKEMIKPILNVNYNFLSFSESETIPVFSSNNYKWGLQMAFPLFLRNPTGEYKMSKVLADNNSLELKDKSNELRFKLQSLQQNMLVLSQQLSNAERSTIYNRQLVEAEKLKFSNGESSLFMINTREYRLLEAELKLTNYKLNYIVNVLSIIYLKGNLNYNLD